MQGSALPTSIKCAGPGFFLLQLITTTTMAASIDATEEVKKCLCIFTVYTFKFIVERGILCGILCGYSYRRYYNKKSNNWSVHFTKEAKTFPTFRRQFLGEDWRVGQAFLEEELFQKMTLSVLGWLAQQTHHPPLLNLWQDTFPGEQWHL